MSQCSTGREDANLKYMQERQDEQLKVNVRKTFNSKEHKVLQLWAGENKQTQAVKTLYCLIRTKVARFLKLTLKSLLCLYLSPHPTWPPGAARHLQLIRIPICLWHRNHKRSLPPSTDKYHCACRQKLNETFLSLKAVWCKQLCVVSERWDSFLTHSSAILWVNNGQCTLCLI